MKHIGYRAVSAAFGRALHKHPLGIASANGRLRIADTYNNRLREIDLSASTIRTAAGTGHEGLYDGTGERARFDEPGGVSFADDKVYIADTNNHAIRVFDTRTREVRTFDLSESAFVPEGATALRARILPPERLSPHR